MHIHVFTLKFNAVIDRFDDSELQAFVSEILWMRSVDHDCPKGLLVSLAV